MAAKISGDDEPISDINIVPFVDIILVVLIIFMITTPFIMQSHIKIDLPQAASGEDGTPSEFNISVASDGRILLNGEVSDLQRVNAKSQELSQTNPEVQAIIAADREVPHGQVVEVIDAVKTGGVKRFAITIDRKRQ